MTDNELQQLYSKALGVSHGAALRTVYSAGYQSHSGVALGGSADPSKVASTASTVEIIRDPDGSGRHA